MLDTCSRWYREYRYVPVLTFLFLTQGDLLVTKEAQQAQRTHLATFFQTDIQ